ncbi:MAG: APC family permease [Lachnospiraceae bacterium]|nr:APC family permease [Lachnospiraceae bacterium]
MKYHRVINLKSDLSPINVWALSFVCIAGGGAFVVPGLLMLPTAGAVGTMAAFAIGLVAIISLALNDDYMTVHYPVDEGEFTSLEKTFGREHAFLCTWFLAVAEIAAIALDAIFLSYMVKECFAGKVVKLKLSYDIGGYELGIGEVFTGVMLVMITGGLCIKGAHLVGNLQTALAEISLFLVVVLFVVALVGGHADFSLIHDRLEEGKGGIRSVLSIASIMPWLFMGFEAVTHATEEFRFPVKKLMSVMIAAVMSGALFYVLTTLLSATVAKSGGDLPLFDAARICFGDAGPYLVLVAAGSMVIASLMGLFNSASKVIYSMAEVNVLPRWFRILSRVLTPENTYFFIAVLASLAQFFGMAAVGSLIPVASIGACVGFIYTSAAAFVTAKKEGNTFFKINSVAGIIFAVAFLVIMLAPGLSYLAPGISTWLLLALWTMIGFGYFWQAFHKIDIR